MFHAAQAFIIERTNEAGKTHKGVRAQFHRLVREEPSLDQELPKTLTRTYQFKEAADYETGVDAEVTSSEAAAALDAARNFVSELRRALSPPASNPAISD